MAHFSKSKKKSFKFQEDQDEVDEQGVSNSYSEASDSEPEEEALRDGIEDQSNQDPDSDENQSDSDEDADEDQDQGSDQDIDSHSQRTAIRKELSSLSFAELEELKSKIGTKEWNEAMFGSSNKSGPAPKKKQRFEAIKRENKNRPRELSAKIRVPRIRSVVPVKKREVRDPRFESFCGEMNDKIWSKNYEFLDELRKNELEDLKSKMKTEEDGDKRAEIKQTLQKLINKEKSDAKKKELEEKKNKEREENIQRLKEGKKPYYMKKSTKKYVELAEKYDELKSSGKLESYLKKKRQKNAVRDKKVLKLPKN